LRRFRNGSAAIADNHTNPTYVVTMATTSISDLLALKTELQNLAPADFERLIAALIGRIMGITITVAKSGFQHGADAGTAGRQSRRLRIETKRYSDTNPLNERELLGELEQASQRDPALELWVLGATTETKEQLENSLYASGLKQGIPVLIVDWKQGGQFPAVAALCASDPDVVDEIAGVTAGNLARRLVPAAGHAIGALRRDLSAWQPGFETVAKSAQTWLERLWNSPAESVAALGQDAAGGSESTFLARTAVIKDLDDWQVAATNAPAVVVGEEGMGKTWATLGWLNANLASLPITLVIPSGAVGAGASITSTGLKTLIGRRLHEIAGVRDEGYWIARVDRLLERPASEGPILLLVLDGMNQAPDAPWLALHQQLQAGPFADKVRVLSTTRPMFLETTLRNMRGLVTPPTSIEVGPYDLTKGGEFDRMLASRGLRREQIRDELVPLASVPRLFDLVIRLRDRLQDLERVTVHGLLWEYGRDTLGTRGGRAFTEPEWREWLARVAERLRSTGSARITRHELEELTARPTLGSSEVFARLSDIVDSHISDTDGAGRVVFRPEIVAHALGAAVLAHLNEVATAKPQDVASQLDLWLGPISGLSERGEILRAAVAILCASPDATNPIVSNAVVAAWLTTQNLPETHGRDVIAVAPEIVESLLAAVESMTGGAFESPRDTAIGGLRSIPRANEQAREAVKQATTRWMSVVSRGVEEGVTGSDDHERARSKRMKERIGSDTDGPQTILGRNLEFVPRADGAAFTQVPALLDGYAIAPFVDVLELAAIHLAIRGRLDAWASLKWLVLWNDVDFEDTAAALATRADEVLARTVEPGVEPLLRERVAALLLWLSADVAMERRATELNPGLDTWFDYETDYEASPAKSMFTLERRHAEQVLADRDLSAAARARRVKNFWWDPSLVVPEGVPDEISAAGEAFEVTRLGLGRFRTAEDLDFDHLALALARCSPTALARLARRRIAALASLEDIPPGIGDAAYDALLIGDTVTAEALRRTRLRSSAEVESHEDGLRQLLLQPELIELEGEAQVDAIIAADLKRLYVNVEPFLKPLDIAAVDFLVDRHSTGEPGEVKLLVDLLNVMAEGVSERVGGWLEELALDETSACRSSAFDLLARCRGATFGRTLLSADWSWEKAGNEYLAHHGSLALIDAGANAPFETVAPRIAPWLVAHAARERGSAPSEARLVAEILDRIVSSPIAEVPDPGSDITIDLVGRESDPFALSLTPDLTAPNADPLERINATMDQAWREQAARRAVAVAVERIAAARSEGASLYLASIDAYDLAPLLTHAAPFVDRWLEGMQSQSLEFKRRVRLAEGFYLALTEALLRVDLERGTLLWVAVRASMHTKFIDAAGLDKMVTILLRAPADDRIDELVRDLVEPRLGHSDDLLLDFSVAAAAAGRGQLLTTISEADRRSGIVWRLERAKTLMAFAPGEGASAVFPDGRTTDTERRDAAWGERRYRDTAARHWWNAFWSASSGEEAYASWILLEATVDRRAIEWTTREWPGAQANHPLMDRKRAFAINRRNDLKRAAEDTDKKLGRTLFGRDIVNDIYPWTALAGVDR
jgi:hypothetical protein